MAGFHLDQEHSSVRALLASTWAAVPLIRLLARKEFHVRYRRASFGVLWAIALPLLQAVVLAVVLDRVARFDVGIALSVFIFAGTLSFGFVTSSIGAASTSIVDNTAVSSRIYFPRMVLPLMAVGANLYGIAVGLVVLAGLTLVAGASIGPELVLLVPALALALALTTGLALVTSALHVYFRDVKYLVTAATTVWFYATPIFYPLHALDGTARSVVVANPATGIVQLFRAALGVGTVSLGPSVAVCAAAGLATVTLGVVLHARWDRLFADLL